MEKALREKSWTEAVILDLIKQTGSSRASIYRDRRVVLAKLAEEEANGLEERRAAFLLDVRRVQKEARDAGQFSPATRLLAMESQVLGLDRVPLPTVDEGDVDAPVDTSLEGLLREVRKMRLASQAGHVYTAAEKLLEREHAILNDIRLRDEAAAAANMTHLSTAEKVTLVTDILKGLPEVLRRQVLASVEP